MNDHVIKDNRLVLPEVRVDLNNATPGGRIRVRANRLPGVCLGSRVGQRVTAVDMSDPNDSFRAVCVEHDGELAVLQLQPPRVRRVP